jgi:hypothetical protein
MKSTLKPYHNKLKALFSQKAAEVISPDTITVMDVKPGYFADEPAAVGREATEPPAPVSPHPVDSGGPAPHYSDKKAFAEYVAKQNGYVPGFEVTASVSPKKVQNNHFVYILVPNWSELCLMRVKTQEEWPAGSRPDCQYAHANADGTLVFDTKQRGPRWKRKGGR